MKDLSVARAIADTVDVCPDLPLLEVGPGMSVLTQYLLTKGSVEGTLDRGLQTIARNTISLHFLHFS